MKLEKCNMFSDVYNVYMAMTYGSRNSIHNVKQDIINIIRKTITYNVSLELYPNILDFIDNQVQDAFRHIVRRTINETKSI